MLVRPMIGSWEVSRIEVIATHEARRLAVLPVPGLSGDLHQDLGRGALAVEISGSLLGDEARDEFLKELREKFLAGERIYFRDAQGSRLIARNRPQSHRRRGAQSGRDAQFVCPQSRSS